jgi:hypothetical protein
MSRHSDLGEKFAGRIRVVGGDVGAAGAMERAATTEACSS